MACCSAGFLARRFCCGGWNNKGGKFRNFESINRMSKVDTEGGKSFCSSPKLFQDTRNSTTVFALLSWLGKNLSGKKRQIMRCKKTMLTYLKSSRNHLITHFFLYHSLYRVICQDKVSSRRLMGSTNQADPCLFCFRISWILIEQCCFYFFFVPSIFCRASEKLRKIGAFF